MTNIIRFEPDSLSPDNRVFVGRDLHGQYFVEVCSTARLRRIAEMERLALHAEPNELRAIDADLGGDDGLRMTMRGELDHIIGVARGYAVINPTIIDMLRKS